jgi:hypothetical protein
MAMNTIDLQQKLIENRNKNISEEVLLAEVRTILNEDALIRESVKEKLNNQSSTKMNHFEFDLLETDKIFHLSQIKNICIDYRLRFLDSHLFKNDVPEEAISKIKNLEKKHQTSLEGFKIMAPSKLFHLVNYDDPLLFAPMGNDYYYLIHKWGNDINPLRKMMVRPFRNLSSFLVLLLAISFVLTFITPYDILGQVSPEIFKLLSFMFIFKSLCGIAIYYCFWKGKNFNEAIWNSKYYN